jgi:hypothetical protein
VPRVVAKADGATDKNAAVVDIAAMYFFM